MISLIWLNIGLFYHCLEKETLKISKPFREGGTPRSAGLLLKKP
jgi:hypothetical protein